MGEELAGSEVTSCRWTSTRSVESRLRSLGSARTREAASGITKFLMELESVQIPFVPKPDRRARIPEPPPVRLVTVDDAHLPAAAGAEVQLDEFYGKLLGFERQPASEFPVYRAENFRLLFDVLEPPIVREDFRPLRIEVPSLESTEQKLIDAEIEYSRQRGLMPGQESLVLLDPAGNWVEITEGRAIG